jgi:hypothetical protein
LSIGNVILGRVFNFKLFSLLINYLTFNNRSFGKVLAYKKKVLNGSGRDCSLGIGKCMAIFANEIRNLITVNTSYIKQEQK